MAKLLQQTAKSCQFEIKFLKKCIFMAFLRNEGFFVFLYEKVVVILQWISRETEKSVVFDMVEEGI